MTPCACLPVVWTAESLQRGLAPLHLTRLAQRQLPVAHRLHLTDEVVRVGGLGQGPRSGTHASGPGPRRR